MANEYCPETETIYRIPEPDENNHTAASSLPEDYCTTHVWENPPDLPDIYNPGSTETPGGSSNNEQTSPPSGSQTLAAPTSVSASKRNNTNVYVSWQNSNSGNLKYEVEYWSDGSSRHTITTYFTDLTVSNLTPGQNYSFRVRALTDSEDAYSPWSDSYSVSL